MSRTYWDHVAELLALPEAEREARLADPYGEKAKAKADKLRDAHEAAWLAAWRDRGVALALELEAAPAAPAATPQEEAAELARSLFMLVALVAGIAALVWLIAVTWSLLPWVLFIAAGVVLGGLVLGAMGAASARA